MLEVSAVGVVACLCVYVCLRGGGEGGWIGSFDTTLYTRVPFSLRMSALGGCSADGEGVRLPLSGRACNNDGRCGGGFDR